MQEPEEHVTSTEPDLNQDTSHSDAAALITAPAYISFEVSERPNTKYTVCNVMIEYFLSIFTVFPLSAQFSSFILNVLHFGLHNSALVGWVIVCGCHGNSSRIEVRDVFFPTNLLLVLLFWINYSWFWYSDSVCSCWSNFSAPVLLSWSLILEQLMVNWCKKHDQIIWQLKRIINHQEKCFKEQHTGP